MFEREKMQSKIVKLIRRLEKIRGFVEESYSIQDQLLELITEPVVVDEKEYSVVDIKWKSVKMTPKVLKVKEVE
jgi:hypothetical protein